MVAHAYNPSTREAEAGDHHKASMIYIASPRLVRGKQWNWLGKKKKQIWTGGGWCESHCGVQEGRDTEFTGYFSLKTFEYGPMEGRKQKVGVKEKTRKDTC